jgi:hypothetical protein
LTVAQVSEFSLILGSMALSLGHIEAPVLGLITLVGLITIGVSTYMILYSHQGHKHFGELRLLLQQAEHHGLVNPENMGVFDRDRRRRPNRLAYRQDSPIKAPRSRIATTASLPCFEATVTFTLPAWM